MLGVLVLFLAAVVAVIARDMRTPPRRRRARKPSPDAASLQLLRPGRSTIPAGANIAVVGPRFSIGRVPGNGLVLDDETVSSRHAVLELNGRNWLVRDLGSTNGTYLNRQRLSGAAPVQDGDEVAFGGVVTRFLQG
jgi:pSer/pThr/pTyr-binding forkhead associated (FHA) protein